MFLLGPNLLISKLIMNRFSFSFFVFNVFEIAYQNANLEIVDVVAICFEMQ